MLFLPLSVEDAGITRFLLFMMDEARLSFVLFRQRPLYKDSDCFLMKKVEVGIRLKIYMMMDGLKTSNGDDLLAAATRNSLSD